MQAVEIDKGTKEMMGAAERLKIIEDAILLLVGRFNMLSFHVLSINQSLSRNEAVTNEYETISRLGITNSDLSNLRKAQAEASLEKYNSVIQHYTRKLHKRTAAVIYVIFGVIVGGGLISEEVGRAPKIDARVELVAVVSAILLWPIYVPDWAWAQMREASQAVALEPTGTRNLTP